MTSIVAAVGFTDGSSNAARYAADMAAATVDEGIEEYLRYHVTDWLVVFPKKSGLFHLHKSLSKNIVLHCPLPVMSVHE